ncbi:MAG: (Fe-S)-binding protein, partial [Chloroflexota bacterium]|nr:(Fe-S)-binding protein [Chloroflexota bacterium]
HTIRVFEPDPAPIVLPSGSCAAMLRYGYLELFADDAKWLPRAQAIAERTYEFTEFLVDVLGVADLGASFPGPVTYHPSCHLSRGMGVDAQPRLLLSYVRDANFTDGRPLALRELPHQEDCCGFGGVFSVEHPEISAEMLQRKIDNIEASGASTVVTADMGCLLHISGGLHRQGKAQKVVHIAEVLASF